MKMESAQSDKLVQADALTGALDRLGRPVPSMILSRAGDGPQLSATFVGCLA